MLLGCYFLECGWWVGRKTEVCTCALCFCASVPVYACLFVCMSEKNDKTNERSLAGKEEDRSETSLKEV